MNGLVHKKSVGIKAGKNNRGVVVTHTKSKGEYHVNLSAFSSSPWEEAGNGWRYLEICTSYMQVI